MEESAPRTIQWWTLALYAGSVCLSVLWAGRQISSFGHLPMALLCVPVALYAAFLAYSAIHMRPKDGHESAFSALYSLLVLLHAAAGFIALLGLATARLAPRGLRPGWAISLALGSVFFGRFASQFMLLFAQRAMLYSLTNVGMLLYVLILMIVL